MLFRSICKLGMKNSLFQIVNDRHRINLLKEYAGLPSRDTIIVYPGCYKVRPTTFEPRETIRENWGLPREAFIIGSSGGFNLTAGADWLLDYMRETHDVYAVIQPLGVTPLSMFLLESLEFDKRLFLQKERLSWFEAWRISIGFDVGLSIYKNPAPQFQMMGISSNRLCMFIAMGIPVIATRQESFTFLEDYDCGLMVGNYDEFKLALAEIRNRRQEMSSNCERCFQEYIMSAQRYQHLVTLIQNKTGR